MDQITPDQLRALIAAAKPHETSVTHSPLDQLANVALLTFGMFAEALLKDLEAGK